LWRFERGEKKTVLNDIWKGEETLLLILMALAAHELCQQGSLCTPVPGYVMVYVYGQVIGYKFVLLHELAEKISRYFTPTCIEERHKN
jgi:hypothetical protein